MKFKDERLKIMNEILNGIKVNSPLQVIRGVRQYLLRSLKGFKALMSEENKWHVALRHL